LKLIFLCEQDETDTNSVLQGTPPNLEGELDYLEQVNARKKELKKNFSQLPYSCISSLQIFQVLARVMGELKNVKDQLKDITHRQNETENKLKAMSSSLHKLKTGWRDRFICKIFNKTTVIIW